MSAGFQIIELLNKLISFSLLFKKGKWLGLIGSALLLFSLTIKWYFLLDDNSNSLQNLLTWCLIIGSIAIFGLGVMFVVGLHWYVEKRYSSNVAGEENGKTQKHLKHLKDEYHNQSKRYKKSSSGWLSKWRREKDFRIDTEPVENGENHLTSNQSSIKQNSTTIYNTNLTDNSSFQIISNDSNYTSTDAASTSTASFSSTKKLVRSNSKFNTPSLPPQLPIIDETKQQSANEAHLKSNQTVAYVAEPNQSSDLFETKNVDKVNKTKHMHKLSTSSAKNYILETFLKQQDLNAQPESNPMSNQFVNTELGNSCQLNQVNKSIQNQVVNQLSNQSSISSQTNGAENNALDLTE